MITEKQIEIARILLATGLVNSVYHSVELVENDKGIIFPAYKIGDEQIYIGPDDSKKMFAYIRSGGSVQMRDKNEIGSCSKMYILSAPTRIVIFQDRVKDDFDMLIKKFLKVAFVTNVTLSGWNNNAFQLGKQESALGDFAFDATTFYLAIDVQIKFFLVADTCNEPCLTYSNPICS